MKKPNLFLLGAPKCGTTSLAAILSSHPQVFLPEMKEPRYFDANIYYDYEEDYPYKNIEQYLRLYDSNNAGSCKYRLDASVFNMYSERGLQEILALSPESKFIIVIRDPVSASKSMFSQRQKHVLKHLREISCDFEECWDALKFRKLGEKFPKGCRNKILFRYDELYSYEKYLPFIFNLIKPENLMLISYDDFCSNNEQVLNQLIEYLNLDKTMVLSNKKENVSYHVTPSLADIIIENVAHKTFNLRKKLNLNMGGKVINKLRRVSKRNENHSLNISTNIDEKVRKEFGKTYEYLDSIGFKI